MPPDIFISYSRADDTSPEGGSGIVTRIVKYIQTIGQHKLGRELHVFRDVNLSSGVDWESEIFNNLRCSSVFLPIFSPSWTNSLFCMREWDEYWLTIRDKLKIQDRSRIIPISFELSGSEEGLLAKQRSLQVVHRFRNGMSSQDFETTVISLVDEVSEVLRLIQRDDTAP